MSELLFETLGLYKDALRGMLASFARGWVAVLAMVAFASVMLFATTLAAPLGMVGGLVLGAVNALLIGAMLRLIEQAVLSTRRLGFQDIWESVGQYFWDVISVGFVLWVPIMLLDKGLAANPNGAFLATAVFLLLFILLNPTPEVIYQVRHGSPLEVLKTSYEFIIENWIEWFLPLAIVLAPLGLSFFFSLSSVLGRGAGLDLFQMLALPFSLLTAWLAYLGLPEGASTLLVLTMTPPLAVGIMFFRGHLFASLYGSSRRQRLLRRRFGSA